MTAGRKEATWPAYTGDYGVKVSLRQPVVIVLVPFLVMSMYVPFTSSLSDKEGFPRFSRFALISIPHILHSLSALSLGYPRVFTVIESVFDLTLHSALHQKLKPALSIRADFPLANL
jgi:hypothetical protein